MRAMIASISETWAFASWAARLRGNVNEVAAPARVRWIAFLRVIGCMGFSRDALRRAVALLCLFLIHLAAEDAGSAEGMPGGGSRKCERAKARKKTEQCPGGVISEMRKGGNAESGWGIVGATRDGFQADKRLIKMLELTLFLAARSEIHRAGATAICQRGGE
jgi:hypothetical protein